MAPPAGQKRLELVAHVVDTAPHRSADDDRLGTIMQL